MADIIVTAKGKPARQPRGILNVNGQRVPWVSWECDNNSFFAADTFRAVFPISALPKSRPTTWWATQAEIDIEIFAGLPPDPSSFTSSDLQSLIYGRVDELTYDPVAQTFEASGRDLTGALIDDKTTQKWTGKRSSDIATTIAKQFGLRPVVTATSTLVGAYYQLDHVKADLSKPAWDLLTWLARKEHFVVYVQGKELHFEPAPTATQTPRVFTYIPPPADGGPPHFPGTSIKVSRSLTLAKDVKVEVSSWSRKTKKAFTKSATAAHTKNAVTRRSPVASGETQTFSYAFRGLTPEAAQQRANQLALEISSHELKLEIDGPADNNLGRTDVIQLKGTIYDQVFFIDSLTRSMSDEEGYTWRIAGKNHGPESQPTL